jgi:hypothetical protein
MKLQEVLGYIPKEELEIYRLKWLIFVIRLNIAELK